MARFIGKNTDFTWFSGVVEDRLDPLYAGRLRVRCLGFHTDNKSELPTEDLPWAMCVLSTASPGISGLGTSPSFLVEGSWVWGYFRDSGHQEPVIIGSLPGKPKLYGNPDIGFNGPTRRSDEDIEDKAIEDYSTDNEDDDNYHKSVYPKNINEPDVNRLAVNDLLLEHKVIFFRDQPITKEQQIALAEKFGPLETHAYVKGLENYPEIVRIIKGKEEKNQWGENWHSDVSYNVKPTKAVILRSLKIPPVGGDTCFSNMELAWETLDPKIQDKIKNKKAIHSSLGAEFFIDNYKYMEGNEKRNYDSYSNEHPIVRTHPETGKKILYVNWTYTKQIIGMDKEESDQILKEIFEHQARLDLTCRFSWTEDTVAIWDNRSVIHYAIADFFPGRGLGYERIMDRIAIEGDHPQ